MTVSFYYALYLLCSHFKQVLIFQNAQHHLRNTGLPRCQVFSRNLYNYHVQIYWVTAITIGLSPRTAHLPCSYSGCHNQTANAPALVVGSCGRHGPAVTASWFLWSSWLSCHYVLVPVVVMARLSLRLGSCGSHGSAVTTS